MIGTPVHILTGFLGSGKTTAITDLLKQKESPGEWAVIINEFGRISIDSMTLQAVKGSDEDIYEISGGCICCSAKEHFLANLSRIVDRGRFERIIIEPSGLGGVEMVSALVREHPKLQLMPVFCMVDIFSLENPRMEINMIYRSQIVQAEAVLFTKCDLITDRSKQKKLLEKFQFMFPDKTYFLKSALMRSEIQQLIIETKLPQSGQPRNLFFPVDMAFESDRYREESFVYQDNIFFDLEKLGDYFLENELIIRAKGYLQDKKGWKSINFTRSGFNMEPCPNKKENKLVVISIHSDSNHLTDLRKDIKNSMCIP